MLPGLITSGGPIIAKLKPRYIDVGYSANTNLRALHDAYYNTYPAKQVVVFTISSYVFSGAYYAPALDLSNFPADFEIILVNNGHIRGAGGAGGGYSGSTAAEPGGTALYLRNYVKIQNNGTIYGGGGGGNGNAGNGGGGGAGVNPGLGGNHYPGFGRAPDGSEYSGGYIGDGQGRSGGDVGQGSANGQRAGYCWDGGGYILSFGTWDSVRNIWTNTGNPGAYLGPGA
jgi:hypothetical protein